MPGQTAVAAPRGGETFRENSNKKDIRMMNIEAAKAVADAIRTSLGPRGADKMVAQADGHVIITNDGATILNKMAVEQPAAKMLVELSRSQDQVAGDGTTSVTVLCGALLKKSLELLERGVHPTAISDAFVRAQEKAQELLRDVSIPVAAGDRDSLVKAAATSLSSKVVHAYSDLLSPMAVDCLLRVADPATLETRRDGGGGEAGAGPDGEGDGGAAAAGPDGEGAGMGAGPDGEGSGAGARSAAAAPPSRRTAAPASLNDIRVIAKTGGTIDDSRLIDGLALNLLAAKAANGPTRVVDAKIALVQFQFSPPKSDVENSVTVSDYQAMDRILREERNHILGLVKKVRACGANVVLIQKSILRDAVTDLALHYLAKAKIMVVRDVEREDVEWICKGLGCIPIAHPDGLSPDKLARAALCAEVDIGGGRITEITGIANPGRTATVLLRGSNEMVLGEADRSLHDALCVVRCLLQERSLVAGGGAPEVHLAVRLAQWAKTLVGMPMYCVRAYAEALEVIPYTLAENAGLNAIEIVTELRARHTAGHSHVGINVRKNAVTDMLEEDVVQPLLVTSSALALATECVQLILKIDDVVPVR